MSQIGTAHDVNERGPASKASVPEMEVSVPQKSELQEVFTHLLRNRAAVVGLLIIGLFFAAALFAPVLATHNPTTTVLENRLAGPGSDHWFGTDELGRDLYSWMLYGGRISMRIGIISVLIGLVFGVPIGAISGYYGGKLDMITQRFIDMLIAFPGILLAIVVVTVLGVGVQNVMIAVGIASVPLYARLVRGSVLSAKEQSYVTAGKAAGLRDWRIIFRHILPNCLAPIIVQSTFQIATAILWAAGLGFLGLGA